MRAAIPYLRSWVDYRRWALRTPGVQYAVRFDGELQLSGASGVANIETGEVLTTDHLFRIASHSKTFTATAILQLAEAGALRLDDTAVSFVPSLAGSAVAEVTVRELLGHSGGIIRDGLDGDYWQHSRPFPDEAELLEILIREGKVLDRNEKFKYTNIGYSLLGLIIAAASGRSYNAYVAQEICARLGLGNTGPEWDDARASEFAAAHTGLHLSRTRRRVDHVDTRAMAAATGFFSTAEDLTHYFSAHSFGDERMLSDASKRLQQRHEWISDPDDAAAAHYGLGMISEKVGSHEVFGHSGGYPGHITRSVFDPHTGLVVSVLTNSVDGPAAELSQGILALLDYAAEKPATASTPDASRFTGRFANMWGPADVVQLGERIVMVHPSAASPVSSVEVMEVAGPDSLRIVSGTGFGSPGELLRYRFEGDRVVSVSGGGGMTMWPHGDIDDE
ncbi:beta-lactamase family protein [Homoserinibacter sp. GY 40078]|nr:beta-lactamase family protein [Homoserinibacter sp. GY 40078]